MAQIMRLSQAGFVVKTGDVTFAVDPFCGTAKGGDVRLFAPLIEKHSIQADFILTSHAHYDHFDPETYTDYISTPKIIGPDSCMKALEKSGLPIEGIALNRRGKTTCCGIAIEATYADHDSDSIGFVVTVEGKRCYFSGDTLMTTKMLLPNLKIAPDIMFICINGKLGNMTVFEAAGYVGALEPKVAVPTHYDLIQHNTEDPEKLGKMLTRMGGKTKGFIMEAGKWYDFSQLFA